MQQQQSSSAIAAKKKRSENSMQQNSRQLDSISSEPDQFHYVPNQMLMSKPVNVGEFSLDEKRNQQLGRSRVRYLNEAAVDRNKRMSTNLAQGIGEFVEKSCDEGIDQILRWIVKMAAPNSTLKKTIHESEFVVWRGTMTRLLVSPYDVDKFSVGLKIACVKYKGVYFLREFDTEAKVRSEAGRSDYQRRASYAGLKFEQICTVDELGGQKVDPMTPVNANNEFVGMFKATLKSPEDGRGHASPNGNFPPPKPPPIFRLLFGAEIDCISPEQGGQYMEIKTQYKEFGHGNGFGNKAFKWWIQSYLVGIRQLIIGLHENLILNRVELHQIDELPRFFSIGDDKPKMVCCFGFLHAFFETVKTYLDNEDGDENGGILVAERLPNSYDFNFQFFPADNAEAAAQYPVLTEEFKAHGWK